MAADLTPGQPLAACCCRARGIWTAVGRALRPWVHHLCRRARMHAGTLQPLPERDLPTSWYHWWALNDRWRA